MLKGSKLNIFVTYYCYCIIAEFEVFILTVSASNSNKTILNLLALTFEYLSSIYIAPQKNKF